jgi:glycosyltransferase involved in cell wall biosynthesis
MRLLLISHSFPLPPHDGGRIAFFNTVKYLGRAHEVGVVCLAGADEQVSVADLENHCSFVRVFRRNARGDLLGLLRGVISDAPGATLKYWYPAAGELIRQTIVAHQPDVVEFHHLNTAIYRRFAGRVPAVLREHNVEYKVWERYAEHASGWAERSYAKWTTPRVRRYEAKVAQQFDRCVVVSPADAEYLRIASPGARIEVIPLGVDTEYFYPRPEVGAEPFSVTMTGSFEWGPKQQSLFALLSRVFPILRGKLREAKLYVVGKGVPEDLKKLAEGMPGVVLTGQVVDVRPYIARSSLLINYMESGGGIALKVLEAMAMRKPVLCNLLGCERIPVVQGRDMFVADGPEEFATAAVHLLGNESVRRQLAENAYRRVLTQYSWSVIASQLERFYETLLPERRAFGPVVQPRAERLEEERGHATN